jgi:hypothetical protein
VRHHQAQRQVPSYVHIACGHQSIDHERHDQSHAHAEHANTDDTALKGYLVDIFEGEYLADSLRDEHKHGETVCGVVLGEFDHEKVHVRENHRHDDPSADSLPQNAQLQLPVDFILRGFLYYFAPIHQFLFNSTLTVLREAYTLVVTIGCLGLSCADDRRVYVLVR